MARGKLTARAARLLARLAMLGGLACGPAAQAQGALQAVPFDELARGESSTVGAPMLRVASVPAEAAELARVAGRADLAARLADPRLRGRKVIGIFVGPMGSSGHGVTVRGLEAGAGRVRITVEVVRPRADQMTSDVISFPYAIIAAPASLLPQRAVWSVVDSRGERLLPAQRRDRSSHSRPAADASPR